jgi:type VI secretion system protein ImpA
MAVLDAGKLLAPIVGDNPSGPNLDSDAAYLALEQAAANKSGGVVGGAGADGPDWNAVVGQATALFERTKDLRVACFLALGLIHRHGVAAFAEALHVMRGLLETQWPTLHPELDPDDDPTLPLARVMALAALTVPPVLVALRRAPVLSSRALGLLSLNDIAPLEGAPDATRVHAIFQESSLADLEACAASLQGALDDLQGIERVFQAHVPERGPDQSGLLRYFQQAHQAVNARLAERKAAEQAQPAGADAAVGSSARALSGDILSREDVMRALDKISSYFERHEPSSPIPLLIERCKRLVSMNFLEIMGDLAPDGLKQASLAVGKRGDGK